MSSRFSDAPILRDEAGFTLIEVIVALAVVAVSLASIGALVGSSVRGARSLDQRVAAIETSRALLFRFTDRSKLATGSASGETAGFEWRLDASPFSIAFVGSEPNTPWQPEGVVLRVRAPNGQMLRLETIRLIPPETAKAKQ